MLPNNSDFQGTKEQNFLFIAAEPASASCFIMLALHTCQDATLSTSKSSRFCGFVRLCHDAVLLSIQLKLEMLVV